METSESGPKCTGTEVSPTTNPFEDAWLHSREAEERVLSRKSAGKKWEVENLALARTLSVLTCLEAALIQKCSCCSRALGRVLIWKKDDHKAFWICYNQTLSCRQLAAAVSRTKENGLNLDMLRDTLSTTRQARPSKTWQRITSLRLRRPSLSWGCC